MKMFSQIMSHVGFLFSPFFVPFAEDGSGGTDIDFNSLSSEVAGDPPENPDNPDASGTPENPDASSDREPDPNANPDSGKNDPDPSGKPDESAFPSPLSVPDGVNIGMPKKEKPSAQPEPDEVDAVSFDKINVDEYPEPARHNVGILRKKIGRQESLINAFKEAGYSFAEEDGKISIKPPDGADATAIESLKAANKDLEERLGKLSLVETAAFKKKHIEMILAGRKTQTRRLPGER